MAKKRKVTDAEEDDNDNEYNPFIFNQNEVSDDILWIPDDEMESPWLRLEEIIMTEYEDKNRGKEIFFSDPVIVGPKESLLALLSDDSGINTDQEGKSERCIQVNVSNFKDLVINLVKDCHVTQRYKVAIESGQEAPIVKNWGLAEMNYENFTELLQPEQKGTVRITKIALSPAKVNRLTEKNIERKRSVAFAKDIIRGLALNELAKMLQLDYGVTDVMNEKEKKALKNKFTHCSRRDRSKGGAGAKLEEEFLNSHKALNKFSDYKEIDEYFEGISIFIFGCDGYLKYVSKTLCEESVYFYVNGEDEFFLIRNVKGFCRID
ncbi:uncharacterized protein LOC134817106 [Bolinopsis microptera]|uniref:uncharacterized protein LOC134817106 n=1 Tax=Bolinopsis microptera TaxID=2820187 RepID=UPI00307A9A6A